MVQGWPGCADDLLVTLLEGAPTPARHRAASPPARAHGTDATVLPAAPTRSALPSSRALLLGVAGVVVLALVAGALVLLRGDGPHRVLLTVDGEPLVVSSEAGTVGDLLAAQGIAVTAQDRLVPAAGTPTP